MVVKLSRDVAEIARHQREQIDGFGNGSRQRAKWRPPGSSPALDADCRSTAARAQDFLSASMRVSNLRQIVGPVEEIGDAAKAFRLALRAENAVRHVKPFERGVVGGRDFGYDFKREARGRGVDRQGAFAQRIGVFRQRLAART